VSGYGKIPAVTQVTFVESVVKLVPTVLVDSVVVDGDGVVVAAHVPYVHKLVVELK